MLVERDILRSVNATRMESILNKLLCFSDIDDEFRREPTDKIAAVGAKTTIECKGPRGAPEPTITWEKDSQLLINSSRVQVVISGNQGNSRIDRQHADKFNPQFIPIICRYFDQTSKKSKAYTHQPRLYYCLECTTSFSFFSFCFLYFAECSDHFCNTRVVCCISSNYR